MDLTYASKTSVPIDRSQAEIKKILSKYGATSFAFAEGQGNAMLMFEILNRRIVFKLPLPPPPSKNATQASVKTYEQICRSRWRSLVLSIKAKLECVASNISTLEQEFMAHIVLPDGRTVGQFMTPQIESAYKSGKMPPMLGMGTGA